MKIVLTQNRLAAVKKVFEDNFQVAAEVGASVSVWQNGREVLSLHEGHRDRQRTADWTAETIAPFWSATKGLTAATVLLALDEAGIDPGTEIAEVWPEYARNGKEKTTIAEALSHQAGVARLDAEVSIFDYPAVIGAIEAQVPDWRPGEGHGYHARTYGFIAEELVRRVAKVASLGDFFRERIADPLELDLWIGLPEEEFGRVATLFPARGALDTSGEAVEFYKALGDPKSLTRNVFESPGGLHAVREMNESRAWTPGFPAMGGVGSAAGLGKFYALLAGGGVWEGRRFFSERAMAWMEARQCDGHDRVFCMPTAFSHGFMMDPLDGEGTKRRCVMGNSARAFGHPGAGGSHAFADPENRIAFAYVMNQMELGVMPNRKSLQMIEQIYE